MYIDHMLRYLFITTYADIQGVERKKIFTTVNS